MPGFITVPTTTNGLTPRSSWESPVCLSVAVPGLSWASFAARQTSTDFDPKCRSRSPLAVKVALGSVDAGLQTISGVNRAGFGSHRPGRARDALHFTSNGWDMAGIVCRERALRTVLLRRRRGRDSRRHRDAGLTSRDACPLAVSAKGQPPYPVQRPPAEVPLAVALDRGGWDSPWSSL
jgi:hypothetical protein